VDRPRVEITRLPHAPEKLPAYQTEHAVGLDLQLAGSEVTLAPNERALLPTGFAIAIPAGFEGQVRMRSSFALRTGIILPNAPGTIDPDYRGELKVLAMNVSGEPQTIAAGERFAQLVITSYAHAELVEVAELPPTARAGGGFGSTGR
jgi:dUTP pyrophosphatase